MGIPAIVFIWTMPAGWPKEPGNSICRRRRTARPRTVILPWFYLVLLRGYQALYDLDGDPKYVDIFIRWMDWARRNARDAAGLFYNDWSGKKDESATPKWLLDEACIPEYFVRAALIRREVVPAALPR